MSASDSQAEQLSPWSESFDAHTVPLFPQQWIEENTLRPEITRGLGTEVPSDIRKLMRQGVKPRDIIILRRGR